MAAGLVAGFAADLATGLEAGLATCLATLFFSAFRAEPLGAGFARAATDGFDFAAIFLGLATALAMGKPIRLELSNLRAYTILGGSAQAAKPLFQALHVKPSEQTEPDQADDDQIDGYDEIQ
jgi:hypothetical protein